MTPEEHKQVSDYIAKLTAEHKRTMELEVRVRKLAQEDYRKMSAAMMEIWKMSHEQSILLPHEVASNVRKIIDYYCPDFDIPF